MNLSAYGECLTYSRPFIGIQSGTLGLCKDVFDETVEVMTGIRVVEAFAEAINKDTWNWGFDSNIWIGSIVTIKRQEYISWRASSSEALLFVLHETIASDRM